MIGTWRQMQAQENFRDNLSHRLAGGALATEDEAAAAISDALEVATTVKITQDALDAFSMDGTDGDGHVTDIRAGLVHALKALGFEVVG